MSLSPKQVVVAAMERLQARADNAYFSYIGELKRDECLGWEIKVEKGKFGEPEMKAHTTAAQWLGKHRAFADAVAVLNEHLKSLEVPTQ